jgi:hypothetical protein
MFFDPGRNQIIAACNYGRVYINIFGIPHLNFPSFPNLLEKVYLMNIRFMI